MTYTALDVLKYYAVRAKSQIEWATDFISGNVYHELADKDASRVEDVLESPLDTINEFAENLLAAVLEIEPEFKASTGLFSDGRRVSTSVWVEQGCVYVHPWHYDPEKGPQEPYKIRGGRLGADPGQYAGSYDLHVDPAAQTVEAELFKSSFVYYAEPVAAVENMVANVGLGEFTGEFGPEKIALDIGDSVTRRTVYLDPGEAIALADSLTAHADGAKKADSVDVH
ncbi:hypothetical protein [Rhodococcoides fascians]|uniref:hypothetical protein n=1 Tax=Rhodococcoides fascians TaxID=1828 RepID=UPI0005647540|nr:hypothetical protein [Rhodococcus fascians]